MSNNQSNRLLGLAALWTALFLWGMHGPIGRHLALKGVPMTGVMAARLWIGSIFFWTLLLATKKLNLSFLKGNVGKVTLLSLIGIYLNMLTFHYGMNYIPATLVLLLENLAPFMVILFLWMWEKKKPTPIEAACQCIAFAGLLVIVFGKGGISGDWHRFMLGILLEAIAGITWALYCYFSGRWLHTLIYKNPTDKRFYPSLNFICVLFTISAVVATPHLWSLSSPPLEFNDYALIAVIGIFQTSIAFMLWNYALGVLPITVISTSFYMTVVFTCINEVLFLDLKLSWVLLVGSLLILGSALKLARSKPAAA